MKRGLFILLLALPLVTLQLASGCGLQGEGERCSTKNTVDGVSGDCADGLVCVAGAELNNAGTDICCLPNNTSTNPACILGGGSSSSSSGMGASSSSSSASSASSSSSSSASSASSSSSSGMGGGGAGGGTGGGDAG